MNRYNRIFHALRGGKIFSRADQLCTKCNANVIKIPRHFSLCFKSTCQKKSIIKLLWRIIIFFFYSHFRVFHSTDSIIAFANCNQILQILRQEKFSLES